MKQLTKLSEALILKIPNSLVDSSNDFLEFFKQMIKRGYLKG